ncbi:MAG: hypothetical protein KatS3mg076_2919 [Candidatus Binatia bacterium]|nr:MAG: hypothetical protein KatS3mg076_2919 [Candidatus Binatia bacterium]
MQAALTRLWGPAYQSVAAADVVGERSNAGLFDEERGGDYRSEAIGQGLAAAILLGSLGGQGGRSGFSSKDLKLACSKQGVNWNYTDGALLELENRCFYLHTATAGSLGKRYWFGTKPTLNKLVVQYRQQMAKENFDEEILEDLRAESQKSAVAGATWRVIVDPAEDLPEQKSLTLLILPPSLAWDENGGASEAIQEHVKAISTRCGGKERLYRNTLVFLAGTARGLSKLRQAYRERAALEAVRRDFWDQLDDEQREDLKKRLEAARKAALEALGPAYTVALRVHGHEVEVCALSDARPTFQEHLGYLWTTLVEDEEWILRRVGSVTLESTGLIPKEGGLRLVGIGRGASLSSLQARYCREPVSLDPSEDGVWIIPAFTPEPAKAPAGEETAGAGVGAGETGAEGEAGAAATAGGSSGTTTETKAGAKGMVRRFVVRGAVPVENWAELFRCFVGPAARMNLKKLQLGVHFEMVLPEDRPLSENDPALKAMKEAARQLGLKLDTEGCAAPCNAPFRRGDRPWLSRRFLSTRRRSTRRGSSATTLRRSSSTSVVFRRLIWLRSPGGSMCCDTASTTT